MILTRWVKVDIAVQIKNILGLRKCFVTLAENITWWQPAQRQDNIGEP